jgi:hypothetical protein
MLPKNETDHVDWQTPPPLSPYEHNTADQAIDAQWMVDAGADYIKEDSCGGNQTHSVAFSDYAKFRDALNTSGAAAGRPIFFSLCGWEEWYAPPDPSIKYGGGHTLGNSYRIHGDGSSWSHLSGCTNTIVCELCHLQVHQHHIPCLCG